MLITYIAMGITLLITLSASAYLKSTYAKYSKVISDKKITGKEAARKILDKNGLKNVSINEVPGNLTDHYDPSKKEVNLSHDNYVGNSIANVAVAAHECGHAIQDKNNYSFLRMRASLVPIVNLSTRIGYVLILIGFFTAILGLVWIGILLESAILVFQLVTLPVEFDASNRALKELKEYDLLSTNEISGGKAVLKAAALTYVAAVASAIIEILRLVMMFTSNKRK